MKQLLVSHTARNGTVRIVGRDCISAGLNYRDTIQAHSCASTIMQVAVMTVLLLSCAGWLHAGETDPVATWAEAEALFQQAAQAESGSAGAVAAYSNAALKFEFVAREHYRPGVAWYNAGNAWFEAGELGRAIAAYLHARIYRPLDSKVTDSLQVARALRVERVEDGSWNRLLDWPVRWVQALVVSLFILLTVFVLCHIRYRSRWSLMTIGGFGLCILLSLCLLVKVKITQGEQGVLIAQAVEARKGPGYQYQAAFMEPLHNGLEFKLAETRGDWCRVALADGREGWIPARMVRWIHTDH